MNKKHKQKQVKSFEFKPFLLLVIFIINLLFFISEIPYVKSQQVDLTYNFVQNTFFDSNNIQFNDSFNIKNTEYYQDGLYNASFSFSNETIGNEGLQIDFVDDYYYDTNCWVKVKDTLDLHDNILEFYDYQNNNRTYIEHNLPNISNGTIEFWFRSNDVSKRFNIYICDGVTSQAINFFMYNNYFMYFAGAGNQPICSIGSDKWYHIRIVFDTNTNWIVYINNTKYGNYAYRNTPILMDFIYLSTDTTPTDYISYIDAIDFNYTNSYYLNRNQLPLKILNQTQFEIDKDEFTTEYLGMLYSLDYTYNIVNNWTHFGTGAINIWKDDINNEPLFPNKLDFDRAINLWVGAATTFEGIEKNYQDIDGSFINITLSFKIIDNILLGTGGYNFTLRSKLNKDVIILLIDENKGLSYLDNSYTPIKLLHIQNDTEYSLKLFINYELEMCYLKLNNGTNYLFNFNIMNYNQNGIKYIKHEVRNNAGTYGNFHMYLDYIGVYDNGISKANDYGYYSIAKTKDTSFHLQKYFLLTLNATGTFGVIASQTNGINLSLDNQHIIYDIFIHNYTQIFENVYKIQTSGQFLENASISCVFEGNYTYNSNNFNISYFNIEGFSLKQDNIEHLLYFYYTNVNINNSYFYADSSNKLQYRLHSYNLNESMEAYFNINIISCHNYSINFRGYKNSSINAVLDLPYTDNTYSQIQLKGYSETYTFILPQDKFLKAFRFNITDDDSLTGNYTTRGYISPITLNFILDVDFTITTINLLSVLAPLLILIVPTVGFGTYFGKKAILPAFLFMSVICIATGLIPNWIFFVIILAAILFLFMRDRQDKGM